MSQRARATSSVTPAPLWSSRSPALPRPRSRAHTVSVSQSRDCIDISESCDAGHYAPRLFHVRSTFSVDGIRARAVDATADAATQTDCAVPALPPPPPAPAPAAGVRVSDCHLDGGRALHGDRSSGGCARCRLATSGPACGTPGLTRPESCHRTSRERALSQIASPMYYITICQSWGFARCH